MGSDRIPFWDTMTVLLPAAAGLLPLFVIWVAGGFVDFVWIDQPVSPAQGFGILAAMCWPVAALFYVWTQIDTIQGRESLGWPTVPGRLVDWSVKPFASYYGGRRNKLVARYTYMLDGMPYEGTLPVFGPSVVGSGLALDDLCDKYKAGMDVTLRHAPDRPEVVVLEPGDAFARGRMPIVYGLAAVPLVLAVLVAVLN